MAVSIQNIPEYMVPAVILGLTVNPAPEAAFPIGHPKSSPQKLPKKKKQALRCVPLRVES